MLKIILIVAIFVAIVMANNDPDIPGNDESEKIAWTRFVRNHRKSFRNREGLEVKRQTFLKNYRDVVRHNKLFEAGKVKYRRGVFKYSDEAREDFVKTHCGTIPDPNETAPPAPISSRNAHPDTWDIRVNGPGNLTAVRDQGNCAGCWAFATSAAIENGISIKTGVLHNLSDQQQIDCNKDCAGCSGGYIQRSFKYTQNGLTTVEKYPYIMKDGECKENLQMTASNVDFVHLPEDDDAIKAHISQQGACAVCVDANNWWDYSAGIYNGAGDSIVCNHAVLLVGYGPNYWLIKNSWGDWWGEKGYVKVENSRAGGIFKSMVYCPTF